MERLAISAGIAAVLVVTAVAVGAGSDVRLHRLHLPPPAASDETGGSQPPATSNPPAPPGTSPPAAPPPPGAQPPPPPGTPPSAVGCTTGGAASPVATGTLDDFVLTLTPTAVPAAASLTFRGNNVGLVAHSIAIKTPGAAGTRVCGTAAIAVGASDTFTVTDLPVGSYVVYCTIHPAFMHQDITVG